ncbi:MAG: hypothetical protein ACK4PG_03165 [Acetobacteraceae bacterium]
MSRGGFRPGSGRPKGSKTARLPRPGTTAAGASPLAYLLAVMRDEAQPVEVRMRAAGLALPYCHAKPAAGAKAQREAEALTAVRGTDWERLLS